MKKILFLLTALCATNIAISAHQTPVQPLTPAERAEYISAKDCKVAIPVIDSFGYSEVLDTTKKLQILHEKNLLDAEHIKLLAESSKYLKNCCDNHSYYYFTKVLKKYRSEIQNEIKQEKIRHLQLKHPFLKEETHFALSVAYLMIGVRLYYESYNDFITYSANFFEAQKVALNSIPRNIQFTFSFATILMSVGGSYAGYFAYKLYKQYTYISSREKEIKTINSMIAALEEMVEQAQ
jgi:hypothetical protein